MGDNRRNGATTATVADTFSILAKVVFPNVAKGVIKRRPGVVGFAEKFDVDQRAVQLVDRLREKYGRGPVRLRLPLRSHALVLDPQDVEHVLENSPEPFATATWEKYQALGHFQPHQALVTRGVDRAGRRRFNEDVLEPQAVCHHLTSQFAAVISEEAQHMLQRAQENNGILDWEIFAEGWFRVVRGIVLGDSARDDEEITGMLDRLRRNANWAFLHPRQKGLRKRFTDRLIHYLDKGDRGSLAGAVKSMPGPLQANPEQQIPHWLFAFDPAGMTTFRTLALLDTHPRQAAKALGEIRSAGAEGATELPYVRACVLESLRLWPTTPLILRETTRVTDWRNTTLPAGSNIIIFAPFFHRDATHLPGAHQFTPDLWLPYEPKVKASWPVVPFSGGPAMCPGRHVVLLTTSLMIAQLLRMAELQLQQPERLTGQELPGTLDNYSLRFTIVPRGGQGAPEPMAI